MYANKKNCAPSTRISKFVSNPPPPPASCQNFLPTAKFQTKNSILTPLLFLEGVYHHMCFR